MSSSTVCRKSLCWTPSPINSTVQVDVACLAGDCFFACLSVWLNIYFGQTLFDPFKLRMCLAAALSWTEAACATERVRDDLCNFEGLERNAPLSEVQSLVMKSSTWADHPIMSVMALFCTRLIGRRFGFLVIQVFETESRQAKTHIFYAKPPVEQGETDPELELACVLHLFRNEHYLLLADSRTKRTIFDVPNEKWLASTSDEEDVGSEENEISRDDQEL